MSVISPVIATSERTGRPVISETSAVAIATPALGPSLGIAPGGHVHVDVVLAQPLLRVLGAPLAQRWPFTQESAAAADSFITSPSWPVICSRPSPA